MALILVVEDEAAIREMIVFTLETDGYEMAVADCVQKAEIVIQNNLPDAILLDWMLPDRSGVEFLRQLKQHPKTSHIPVIFLTAKSDSQNKVEALDAGADDYITKPFSPKVLLARIRAVLRRVTGHQHQLKIVKIAGLSLDISNHEIIDLESDNVLELGPTEFKLLEFFMTHPNKIYSRASLLDYIWGQSIYLEERTVDVHINRLRKILEPYDKKSIIQTIRSIGYKFSES